MIDTLLPSEPRIDYVQAWIEPVRFAGLALYRVCIQLPDNVVDGEWCEGVTLTHRPMRSGIEANALRDSFHGHKGSVVLLKGWTVRP